MKRKSDNTNRNRMIVKWMTVIVLFVLVIGVGVVFGLNGYIKSSVKDRIITAEDAAILSDVDCILVLGCGVRDDGTPSDMLRDRLLRGIEMYKLGAAPKILMSGDHGQTNYDEVNTMKQYAIDAGVASEDVFMDHAGFSTYESMYRAKEIFQADTILIVTQEYHLYRALYVAEQLGMEAYGVASDYHTYAGQFMRDGREILARCKDFMISIYKPQPTYMGDPIPVNGNGDQTNDR